jgi:hypothetical protein
VGGNASIRAVRCALYSRLIDLADERGAERLRAATKGALDLKGVKVRSILRAAEIDPAITFTSFRMAG